MSASANGSDNDRTWMAERIRALHELVERHEYRGFDPFDLPNAPLLSRIPESWSTVNLIVSKFGSRVAPDALRRLLRVAPVEDPKTYACAYFGYRLSGEPDLMSRAPAMLDRLAAMARAAEGGTYWGYDFLWPTRAGVVSPRGGSTLVPGAFALLALEHGIADTGDRRHAAVVEAALDHYVTQHVRRNRGGEFLAYFPHTHVNTHNANLLGCLALTMGGHLLGNDRHLRLAANAASTSVAAVGSDGYIRYSDHKTGDWTDCFHHLYVLACVRALGALNPHVDVEEFGAAARRLDAYYRARFRRSDGYINYYPDRLHPIDPHNYAATAIYTLLLGEDGHTGEARRLLRLVDDIAWDPKEGRYVHRVHARRRDARFFLRWTQLWMLAALCLAYAGERLADELETARFALARAKLTGVARCRT
jgi:hypothetical protein